METLLSIYFQYRILIHILVIVWLLLLCAGFMIGPLIICPRRLWTRAITVGPFIFIKQSLYTKQVLNHEYVHFLQQRELLFLFARPIYILEFVVKLLWYRNLITAYQSISFEREAFGFQNIIGYCGHRKPFSWRYLIYVRKNKETREHEAKTKKLNNG